MVTETTITKAGAVAITTTGIFATAQISHPDFLLLGSIGGFVSFFSMLNTLFVENQKTTKTANTILLIKSFLLGYFVSLLMFFAIKDGVFTYLISMQNIKISNSLAILISSYSAWYSNKIIELIAKRFGLSKEEK